LPEQLCPGRDRTVEIIASAAPVLFCIDARSQAADRLFSHRVVPRATRFVLPGGIEGERPPIQKLYAALGADETRNALIFDDVLKALEDKRSPVILTERKDHALRLSERLSRFARNVIVLAGGQATTPRHATARNIGATDERVLIATGRYIGEASTMPVSTRCFSLCRSHGRDPRPICRPPAPIDLKFMRSWCSRPPSAS
jgi:hypothetical protein